MCDVGAAITFNEDWCRNMAHVSFKEDRDSMLGLAHASAATAYHRALDLHVRMGCAECGMENEVTEFAAI